MDRIRLAIQCSSADPHSRLGTGSRPCGGDAGVSGGNGGRQRHMGRRGNQNEHSYRSICAGLGTIGSTFLGLFLKLPEATVDLTPWIHWRVPVIPAEIAADTDAGPILVTVEYSVEPEQQAAFLQAIYEYRRIRRRDGAFRWGVFRDLEKPDHYVEIFLVNSWAEHLRQHERSTVVDRRAEERVFRYVTGTPTVRHLVYAEPEAIGYWWRYDRSLDLENG